MNNPEDREKIYRLVRNPLDEGLYFFEILWVKRRRLAYLLGQDKMGVEHVDEKESLNYGWMLEEEKRGTLGQAGNLV